MGNEITLRGLSLIAGKVAGTRGQQFHGRRPGDGDCVFELR